MPLRRVYFPLLVTLCLSIFLLSFVIAPRYAHALALPADPITITSQTYTVHFPNSIDFNVTANDPVSTIVKANIDIDLSVNVPQEIHPVPISKTAHMISLSWHEDTGGSYFIPPGTQVTYSWQFWDRAGNALADAQQQFNTTDTRFNWQYLTRGMLHLNWYNRSQQFGETVLALANASVQRISANLGGVLTQPINLWVYETDQDFHGSLAPGSFEWVGGEALPSLHEASVVVVSTSDDTLVRDMPHELTHLIFHQLIAQGIFAPTWFDEGLAVYNQIYHEPDMTARLEKALATHSLLRLNEITTGFPADANQAYLAYAQSWNLVDYMYSTFGQPRMAQLIKQMNNSQTGFEEDLQHALGVDGAHLENQWRLHLHQPGILIPGKSTPTPKLTPVVKQIQSVTTNDTSFWLLIGLGVLLVLGSLIGLILLLFFSLRRTKVVTGIPNTLYSPNWQEANTPVWHTYTDPSTHMRTSMYARPYSQHASPFQGQEYPTNVPRKQAPQESRTQSPQGDGLA